MDTEANKANGSQEHPRKIRTDQRYNIDILAALTSEQNTLIAFANIANMSAGGANLKLTSPARVPQRFILLMCGKSGPRRQCERVWQSEDSVGVRFIRLEDDL